MPVLYSCTALLKKRREAAILFSRSVSSACNCWKFLVGLQVGIGLGKREDLTQRAGQCILGSASALLRRNPCAVIAELRALTTASSVPLSWAA